MKNQHSKHTIHLRHSTGEYAIYCGSGVLEDVISVIGATSSPDRVFIVSDDQVFPLYGDRLTALLADTYGEVAHFVFPHGEQSKTLDTIAAMYEAFHRAALTRRSLVLALGGGVTGDMAGFAAASYMRGIAYIQIPTTLLAQIDSSIGGKTGVDTPFGKNMVGAFHQPLAVLADSDTLATLPRAYRLDGLGEAIKYGCIADRELFDVLLHGTAQWDAVIPQCAKIKAEIVEADEREGGQRMLLNFGHTCGHALEACQHFSGLSHGLAVGIGMIYAGQIGEYLGITEAGTTQSIIRALEANGMPTQADDVTADAILHAMLADKKRDGDAIHFVLLRNIGSAEICKISYDRLTEIFHALYGA